MKFFTLFAVFALVIAAYSQEPIYIGNKGVVTDYIHSRRMQQQETQGQSLKPRLIKVDLPDENRPRNLQLLKGEDEPINRRLQNAVWIDIDPVRDRRLQDAVYINVNPVNRRLQSNNRINIEHKLPEIENNEIKPKRDIYQIPIDKQINQPLIVIDPITPEGSSPVPSWESNVEQDTFWPPIPLSEDMYPGKHDKNGKHGKNEEHGKHEKKMGPTGPSEFEHNPYENGQFDDYYREYHKEEKGHSQIKHAIFRGFMWAAGITLMVVLCAKCCCGKMKCGRKNKQCRQNGGTIDQQIDFHIAEVRKLEEMKRASQNLNVRVINPYHQMVQPQQPQQPHNYNPQVNSYQARPNPYQVPQQYDNERIVFGQRPTGNFRDARNIPMGRQIPENSFENEYPNI